MLYINEVTLLHKLVGDECYSNITGDDIVKYDCIIEHMMVQNVDDSNNIITSKDSNGAETYINK